MLTISISIYSPFEIDSALII